ncbi:MAG: restriction endonuclease subunit S [Sulfurovum sp.]|nr:restriction endonuclease subunit S [Sulfurovum sp.]
MSELYELPEGWEWKKISETFKIRSGKFLPKKNMVENGRYDVYGGNGINGKYNAYNLDGENIVIGRVGALCGNVRYVNDFIWLTDNAFYISEYLITINPIYLSKYLAFIDLGKTANQAAQPVISYKSISVLDIPLPPLQEQKRIVAKLDSLFVKIDQAIALHQQNIDEADALMGSLLNEVFEELEEKYPEMRRFDTFTKLSRGHNPPKKYFIYQPKDGYVRFLQIRDGSSDKDAVYVPITKKLHLVTKDDLLLVAYRQVGKVFRNMEGAFNVALCKIENIDSSHLSTTYIYYLIHSKYVKGELLKRAERALIPSMSIEHLKSIKIPIPPLSAQQKTVTYLDQLSQKIEKLKQAQQEKMQSLKDLKASLLDRAFRGEL